VFADLGRVLAAGGARPDQATKITIFVAAMGRDQLPAIDAGRVALFGDHKPADTLVGVLSRLRPRDLAVADISLRDRGFSCARKRAVSRVTPRRPLWTNLSSGLNASPAPPIRACDSESTLRNGPGGKPLTIVARAGVGVDLPSRPA
jgi:hypothetical protein